MQNEYSEIQNEYLFLHLFKEYSFIQKEFSFIQNKYSFISRLHFEMHTKIYITVSQKLEILYQLFCNL